MKIIATIKHLSKFPPHIILSKVKNRFKQIRNKKQLSNLYVNTDTRLSQKISVSKLFNQSFLSIFGPPHPLSTFSLLGSGLIHNFYDTETLGLENYKYNQNLDIKEFDKNGDWLGQVVLPSQLDFSKNCWIEILKLNPRYKPIDWQKDFKSGFRWSAKHLFDEQRKLMSEKKGVDLKVPWELSRLQHLPMAAIFASQKSPDNDKLISEIYCQILDFVMANPIGMGVNFNCPMDIGIRNANILLTLNFLPKEKENSQNNGLIANYIAESTKHILEDIEYRDGLTSNHYLGNVLGVLFAGAYLENHKNADQWLAFGIQELERSMARQFFEDGSNFEGSTSYHRLSGEMMIWGAAVVLSLSKDRIEKLKAYQTNGWKYEAPLFKPHKQQFDFEHFILSKSFWCKLKKSLFFAENISKRNGEIPQFGDNDSGRFVRLTPVGKWISAQQAAEKYISLPKNYFEKYPAEQFWDENHLNHAGFISSVYGLMGKKPRNPLHFAAAEYDFFDSIVQQTPQFRSYFNDLSGSILQPVANQIPPLSFAFHKEKTFDFSDREVEFTNKIELNYFPDFQLAVLKNEYFYLALAGISNPKQHHSLGHTHSDKLSVELQVQGDDILLNPGTYLYTPIPEYRELFRSVKSHNTISVNGQEQNTPLQGNLGLFNLKNEVRFELICLTETEIIAQIRYRKIIHRRRIEINQKTIKIEDWCNFDFIQHWNLNNIYSNGYGQRIR
ncbi:MAG: alginate lyase family protein [Flavobacteriales bacterium]|nr:alginate lyase family protein [Flavobacteriales bacterium]